MSLPENSIDLTPKQKAKVLDLLEKHLPDTEVWAYGSRVKWTSKPESDLDLVAFTRPDQKAAVAELKEAFEESTLPFRVDFFEWDEIPEGFQSKIKEQYVVLQERKYVAGSTIITSPTRLGEVADIVTERISTKKLDLKTYISTENMLPNRGGITAPSNIPDQNVTAFKKGDTLFSNIRTYFRKVWLADRNGGASPDVIVFRTKNSESLDSIYLHYLISSEKFIDYTVLTAKGAKMPRGDKAAISIYEFEKIDISSQREAGKFLKTLDDKIALNRKLNETLEEIARALFQSWFVDFDPVKAKLAAPRHGLDPEKACMAAISGKLRIPPGKPTPERLDDQLPSAEELDNAIAALDTLSPEQQAQLAQTAALFPADFQDSDLGLIPEGWEVSEVGKVVSIFGGATPSTKEERFWNGDNAWTTPKDLSGLPSKVLILTERKITDAGVAKISSGQLPVGTVLLSSRAPVGYLALATTPISINQGFIAMVCDKDLPNSYVILWAEANMNEIKSNASGSTFAEISKKAFRPIKVVVPSGHLLAVFHQEISVFYSQITSTEHQSHTLADLRDTLLPKLLSGELSVNEATSNQEAAVS